MGKVLVRYLAGELHAAVYLVVGLTCPILILLFLGDVVHDLVVIGMRRQMFLGLGILPQLAAGGFGLGIAAVTIYGSYFGIIRKLIFVVKRTK